MAVAPRPSRDLTDRVAVVTGGGAAGDGIGNGRAAALLLAEAGARVLVVDRRSELAEGTAAMIGAEGGTAAPFEADVTDEAACAAAVAAATGRWGRLDILINNVGIGSRGSVVDLDLADWDRVMRVNVTSMVLTSRHAVPAMIGGGRGGVVVNISSISALRPRGLTAYSTSKGAVIALTRAMAADHGPDGIRVNCVAPGPVWTPFIPMSEPAHQVAKHGEKTPMGRPAQPEEISPTFVYLASEADSSYITGEVLILLGGEVTTG